MRQGVTESGAGGALLITGGAGFIGSELVRQILGRRDGTRVVVLDKLTYAGNRANLEAVEQDPEQAARFDELMKPKPAKPAGQPAAPCPRTPASQNCKPS